MHVGTVDVKQLWNRLCIGPTADINYVSKVMNDNSQTNKFEYFKDIGVPRNLSLDLRRPISCYLANNQVMYFSAIPSA